VIHIKWNVVDSDVCELGCCRLVRSFEAHEGSWMSFELVGRLNFAGLNITKSLKLISQVLLSKMIREVLYVKIAALLRHLVLDGLMFEFAFSLLLVHTLCYVNGLFVTIEHLFVHFFDSFSSASWTVFKIGFIAIVEANKVDISLFFGF
jgi:hypothetical protein